MEKGLSYLVITARNGTPFLCCFVYLEVVLPIQLNQSSRTFQVGHSHLGIQYCPFHFVLSCHACSCVLVKLIACNPEKTAVFCIKMLFYVFNRVSGTQPFYASMLQH